jgi:hypothetical protein
MTASGSERVRKSAEARTGRVINKIKTAMKEIEAEVKKFGGIYPHNSGRLSMAEVCRRAGVNPITMMGKAHRRTTRLMIQAWIKKLQLIEGADKVRSEVTERAVTAEEKYQQIACQFQAMYQIEMPKRDNEIELLKAQVSELRTENLLLQEAVSDGRVVRLPRNHKSKRK